MTDDDTTGPTILRIVTGAHPDTVRGPGCLEHVALRGDCVCTDAVYFRTEEDGAVVAGWLNRHANCRRKGHDAQPTRTCGIPLGSTDGRIRCQLDISMPTPASYLARGGVDTGNHNHREPHYWTDGADRTYRWTDNEAGE